MKESYEIIDIDKGFKKLDGTKIENLVTYINEIRQTEKAQLAGDNFKISIGTDSAFKSKDTHWNVLYITTIAFTYGNLGTHLIYREDSIRGKWSNKLLLSTRLWREVEISAELAKWLFENVEISPEVHMDINPNENFDSNILFTAAQGYIDSLGFAAQLKPDAAVASCAADHYLRKKNSRTRNREQKRKGKRYA